MDYIGEILDEFEIPRAPSIERGVFYHVAHRQKLAEIAEKGLVPAWYQTERNFPYLPIMDDVVYVWPTLGSAMAYVRGDRQGLGQGNHVIIRVEGVAAERMLPDHEEFTRILDEPESFPGKVEDYVHDLGYSSEAYSLLGYDEAIEIISELDPEHNTVLAHILAKTGNAVGILGIVEPENLHVMELNDWELVRERFESEHPFPEGQEITSEIEEEREELFEHWCYQHDVTRIITLEELQEVIESCGPEEFVTDDLNPSYFSSCSISEWHARQMPQLSALTHGPSEPEQTSAEARLWL